MTTAPPRPGPLAGLCGTLTRLAGRVTTPLLPADYLDVINPMLSGATLRGRVVAIRPETADAATVVIRPGRGWRRHTPGQYLRVGIEVGGVRHWRAFSLTSRVEDPDRCLSITVKTVPGGTVSNHLVRHAAVGTVVHLAQAAGEFTLGAPVPPRVLFLTAGSGITPVLGMLRNLRPDGSRGGSDVVVVHSAPTPEDVIFGAELRWMASTGRIRLVEIHTRDQGRLDITRLGALVEDLAERHTWACGPADMLDMIENHWSATGIADRLRTERFSLRPLTTGDRGTVTFSDSDVTVETDGTHSLLDAGESAGVLMPSGCRMGVCFSCAAPLRRGIVRDLRDGALTVAAEGDGVVIQTCVSAPAGDCDIEL